ncbi:MAG: hypothetical protein M5T61_07795 [Acidimicrobiia bacterium]|nr:hypothetical protein [Acidimicrobiia bacterium]
MHVADDGVGGDDPLAVESDDEAEGAVSCRVLWAHREHHVAGIELDADLSVGKVPVQTGVYLEAGGE